jgi:hypothetical protein
MKIIRNNFFPFGGFKAINIFGVLFCKKKAKLSKTLINHESIHTAQMKELLYLPFYIIYVVEWLIRFICIRDAHSAYRKISFEEEANTNEKNLDYLKERKHFAMWRSGSNN